jgi:nicotinamidase/pyrazinamidase
MSDTKIKALLIVDVQNGFCPGGNLPVQGGDEIVSTINGLIDNGGYDLIVASKDWHPEGHGSFASSHPGKAPFEMGELSGKPQVMWPDHCIQFTKDSEFHPGLNIGRIDFVQLKGEDPLVDSYSAFRDNDENKKTGLDSYLAEQNVTDLDVCGLATDYCVKSTALDARTMLPTVNVRFIEDASRGIAPEGVAAAVTEMEAAGIKTVQSQDISA